MADRPGRNRHRARHDRAGWLSRDGPATDVPGRHTAQIRRSGRGRASRWGDGSGDCSDRAFPGQLPRCRRRRVLLRGCIRHRGNRDPARLRSGRGRQPGRRLGEHARPAAARLAPVGAHRTGHGSANRAAGSGVGRPDAVWNRFRVERRSGGRRDRRHPRVRNGRRRRFRRPARDRRAREPAGRSRVPYTIPRHVRRRCSTRHLAGILHGSGHFRVGDVPQARLVQHRRPRAGPGRRACTLRR